MLYQDKAGAIVAELILKYYPCKPPAIVLEALLWPSCGLMGDNRVYGYAWSVSGIPDFDAPAGRAFMREAGQRLTAEVVHADGTRFVRVFAEVGIREAGPEGEGDA